MRRHDVHDGEVAQLVDGELQVALVFRPRAVENESHAVGERQLAQRLQDGFLLIQLHLHRDGELSTRDSFLQPRPRPPLQQRGQKRKAIGSGCGDDRHLVGTRGVVDYLAGEKRTYRGSASCREPRDCR